MQDSEAMSVTIGNYKGSSTKQKTVTGQLREIIFLNHGEQLVNFFLQVLGQHPLHYQIMRLSNS